MCHDARMEIFALILAIALLLAVCALILLRLLARIDALERRIIGVFLWRIETMRCKDSMSAQQRSMT